MLFPRAMMTLKSRRRVDSYDRLQPFGRIQPTRNGDVLIYHAGRTNVVRGFLLD